MPTFDLYHSLSLSMIDMVEIGTLNSSVAFFVITSNLASVAVSRIFRSCTAHSRTFSFVGIGA
jgi:maleate cis-trans isomerase